LVVFGSYSFFLEGTLKTEQLSLATDQMMPSLGYGGNWSTFQFQGLVQIDSILSATSVRLATAVQVMACGLFLPIETMARGSMHLGMEAEMERLALVALRT